MSEEKKVTLRSKEQVQKARTGEIIRAIRDASEQRQVVDLLWVEELAELVGVDIRRR